MSTTAEASQGRMPRQIPYIIGNEACERFSFYGMRNILTPFLITTLLMFLPEDMRTGEAKHVFHTFVIGVYFFPLLGGWLADRCERTTVHLVCGVVAMLIGLALPWLIQVQWLLWPALVLLGAVAGGVYTLALVLIGQQFKGQDLVTANASVGLLWGVGSLVGPLVSGAAMDVAPHGLPMALAAMAALFVCFARGSRRRAYAARTAQ